MINSTKLVSKNKKKQTNKQEIKQGENCLLDIIWEQILQNNGFLTYMIRVNKRESYNLSAEKTKKVSATLFS